MRIGQIWVKLTLAPTGTHKLMKTQKEPAKGRPDEHTTAFLTFHRHVDPEKKRLPTRLPHQGMRQDKMIGLHSLLTHHRFK